MLLISLFAERLKPLRRKLTIALVTAVILCIVGGTIYEITLEDESRIAQETEAMAQAEKDEKAKAKKQAKKETEEKKLKRKRKKGDKNISIPFVNLL
ncbi:hypothetical protein [Bacillus cereus]|uniref:hypothetical protein n=1 Tax=Bacillus cereus TaxID=1396 RepID=UPI0027DB1138|nr:hypothetical protein [Bacillus cereus]